LEGRRIVIPPISLGVTQIQSLPAAPVCNRQRQAFGIGCFDGSIITFSFPKLELGKERIILLDQKNIQPQLT
jgi:hypothetical protein